jgi:hypothetical protein
LKLSTTIRNSYHDSMYSDLVKLPFESEHHHLVAFEAEHHQRKQLP